MKECMYDLYGKFGELIDILQSDFFNNIGEVWGRFCQKNNVFVIRVVPKNKGEAFLHIVRLENLRNGSTLGEKACIIKIIYDNTYKAFSELRVQ